MSVTNSNSYIGCRFGKLLVTAANGANKLGPRVDVICDCGTEKTVNVANLKTGHTKSCGCLKKIGPVRHGHAKKGQVNRTYAIYRDMMTRCYNANYHEYHLYGGRGIRVCERWQESYENFLDDMGERPEDLTLERNDYDGDYTPDNCRWASIIEQANNKRTNVILEYKGRKQTIVQWARELGVPAKRLYSRRYAGWTDSQILSRN